MTKNEELTSLKKKMEEDMSLPLRSGATQLVFGEGNSDARVYFLGEGPGYHEDKLGRPFVGMAGKLLDQTLKEIGLERKDVYISNVVRFRPPENRDPEPQEIVAFQPYVDEEIRIINPEIIVTLGRFSMGKFLLNVKISAVHGKPFFVEFLRREVLVIPMYHPAAALRRGEVLKDFKEDFKIIIKALNGEIKSSKKREAPQLELF